MQALLATTTIEQAHLGENLTQVKRSSVRYIPNCIYPGGADFVAGGPLQSRSLGGSTNYSTGVIFLNIITDLIGSHRRLESKRQGNEIHCRAPHLGFFQIGQM